MPWCDECSKFWNPTSMGTGGQCPTCDRVIAPPARAPWHFKLLLVALLLYLGFRGVQAIEWVLAHV